MFPATHMRAARQFARAARQCPKDRRPKCSQHSGHRLERDPLPFSPTCQRTITSTATLAGRWLAGDPVLDAELGRSLTTLSARAPGTWSRQTFDIKPSGQNFKEEKFRLSTLDLFNTQNYSTHALFFKVDEAEKANIADAFKRGLRQALNQCRHMFGHLEPNEYGDFSIVTTSKSAVRLVIQWLDDPVTGGFPSYSEIERAKFTSQSLGDISRVTIKGMTMGCRRAPESKPEMAGFQLNFIPGGLIFTVHKHHAGLDIAGTTSLIHQIAANVKHIISRTPTPDWDDSLMDRSRFITSNIAKTNLQLPPPAPGRHQAWLPSSWLLFHLPRSKAAELKWQATPPDGQWISTHDAVVAFLWRVLSKHRAKTYKPNLSEPALLFEAINMRDRLTPPLPTRYQGNALSAGVSIDQPHPLTLAEVITTAPLHQLAQFIRQMTTSATQERLEKTLESLAPFKDKWKLHPRLDAIPPMSLVVTDWRKADMCDTDFGFGRPAAFRQLSDIVIENMMVIYPPLKGNEKDLDNGLEVMVPFESHAVDMFKEDAELTKYFEFRGFEACPPTY